MARDEPRANEVRRYIKVLRATIADHEDRRDRLVAELGDQLRRLDADREYLGRLQMELAQLEAGGKLEPATG